jgi:hypothetical protein
VSLLLLLLLLLHCNNKQRLLSVDVVVASGCLVLARQLTAIEWYQARERAKEKRLNGKNA